VDCVACGKGPIALNYGTGLDLAWFDPYITKFFIYKGTKGAYVHQDCLSEKRKKEIWEEENKERNLPIEQGITATEEKGSIIKKEEYLDFGPDITPEEGKKQEKKEIADFLKKGFKDIDAVFNNQDIEKIIKNAETDPIYEKGFYVFKATPNMKSRFSSFLEGMKVKKEVTLVHVFDGGAKGTDYGWMTEESFARTDKSDLRTDYMIKGTKKEIREVTFPFTGDYYEFFEKAQIKLYTYANKIRRLDNPPKTETSLEDLDFTASESLTARLDEIAGELERVDPRLALALDQVSDRLENR
jgi:hypothetical protein